MWRLPLSHLPLDSSLFEHTVLLTIDVTLMKSRLAARNTASSAPRNNFEEHFATVDLPNHARLASFAAKQTIYVSQAEGQLVCLTNELNFDK